MDGECAVTICNISEMNGTLLVLQMLWQAISVFREPRLYDDKAIDCSHNSLCGD